MENSKEQKGFVLWFTGFSGAGKSTIADGVYEKLKSLGYKLERLDGDIVRENLTKGLGFSKEDRKINLERVSFVSKLLSRNRVGVVASFISPYKSDREEIRKNVTNFIEVFVNTPLEVCENRDVKGLYGKARRGEIKNFTGIDDPYEAPENPEVEIFCDDSQKINESVDKVVDYITKKL